MKLLTILVLAGALAAQESKPTDQATKPPEPTKPTDQAATPAEPAKPAAESWLEGSFEIGFRWIPNINGNYNAYRSVVNFGEGPRLIDADFTLRDPNKRIFDRADVQATCGVIPTILCASTFKRMLGTD